MKKILIILMCILMVSFVSGRSIHPGYGELEGVLGEYVTEPCAPDEEVCCVGGYALLDSKGGNIIRTLNVDDLDEDLSQLLDMEVVIKGNTVDAKCYTFHVTELEVKGEAPRMKTVQDENVFVRFWGWLKGLFQ